MDCPSCAQSNRDDARYCDGCGVSLAQSCQACGAELRPTARFCDGCGASVPRLVASEVTGPKSDVGGSGRIVRSAPGLPTSFVQGRYAVRAFLGEGAKKRVYLAHDTKLDRDVAFAVIKTDGLDADGLVRVRREAQALGRLGDHAHIVTVFDTGDEGGEPYIVAQHMAGGGVDNMLAGCEGHRLANERAMRIAEQVCAALQHAHAHGVLHRDLKPGNVWLDGEGNASLGDFGLALALDRSRMTMAGMMVGTVAYMAPEQALGRAPDIRSDLYALGALLYEMVAGRPPFLGDDAVGVISQHINTMPVAPSWHNPEVPKPLESLILRLLAKSPDERPSSADEVGQELRQILNRSTVSVHPQSQPAVVTDLRSLDWGRFVGRHEEMEQLKAGLESALSGKAVLLLLAGEPGIGKTRLVEEFAVYAGLRGAQVLTGRCYEGEQTVPYRPFVEALRQYARTRPDGELRQQMGAGAPEIAAMVSEIRQRFPDIGQVQNLDADTERLRLFESITGFIRTATLTQPLLLFIDDLHWADKPSLLLLQHLARHASGDRLIVLGTYRDVELERTHPLAEALAALRRLPGFGRLALRGLSEATVEELLTSIDASQESATEWHALAHALSEETEGNPFFIREVLSHLVEEGRLVREHGRWVVRATTLSDLRIPEGVREVIGRRLSRLSPECNRTLTRASTMTRGFDWDVLKAIDPGVPEEQLLDLLDEALAAQLVAERKGETGIAAYDFTHALIRQTLYEELSGPRRVLLHREVAKALEQLWSHQIDQHVGELGYHFYQAAPGGDVSKAVDYCTRAGDRAMTLYGYDDAVAHFDRALQALDLEVEDDAEKRCELLLRRARSLWWAGHFDESKRAADQAGTLAASIGAAQHLATAALSFGGAFAPFEGGTLDKRLRELLELALEALDDADSPLKPQVMARLSAALAFSGKDEARTALLSEQSVEIARRIGDPLVLAAVLIERHSAAWRPGNAAERLAMAEEAIGLAEQAHVAHLAIQGRVWRLLDWLELGDMPAVDREESRYIGELHELRSPYFSWFATVWRATRCVMEGRLAEAETLAQEALAVGQLARTFNAMQLFGVQIASIRLVQGRLQELEPIVRAAQAQYPESFAWQCVLASMFAETGRADEARSIVETLAADDFAVLPRDAFFVISLVMLAIACVRIGDSKHARQLYDLMLPYADRVLIVFGALCFGSVAHFLGMLATATQDWDVATGHFERALATNERMRAWTYLCDTHCEYARALLARDGPGDRERAVDLLQQAVERAQEMGLTRVLGECLTLRLQTQGLTSSDIYTSIDAVARAVEHERPAIGIQAAPDGTVTIMFSDIEDSTTLTERLGDQRWQELLRAHNKIIRDCLSAHNGFEVKTLGDGFMIAFQSALSALECAIAIQRAFERDNPSSGDPLRVRIGVHAGEIIREDNDFYGKNVIMASRVAGQAAGTEILVSDILRRLIDSAVDAALFGAARYVRLKGLATLQTVYPIQWGEARADLGEQSRASSGAITLDPAK